MYNGKERNGGTRRGKSGLKSRTIDVHRRRNDALRSIWNGNGERINESLNFYAKREQCAAIEKRAEQPSPEWRNQLDKHDSIS